VPATPASDTEKTSIPQFGPFAEVLRWFSVSA
jgi:hypothetical protein